MPTYRPYTRISDLPANANGDVTILEAHLDAAHGTITDVLEMLAQAVWSEGGTVIPGTVTNPSDALVRVQGRLGVTMDARTVVAVADQSVDLSSIATGVKCLVVISAAAGATTAHTFTDATTGESLTHNLLSAWGRLEVIEGNASDYPPLPADCVPVAQVTKTGASTLTLDSVTTTAPISRVGGGGGAANFTDLGDVPHNYSGHAGKIPAVKATEDGLEFIEVAGGGSSGAYDLQLRFDGQPASGAISRALTARHVAISQAYPGEVFVGTQPTDGTATLDLEVSGVPLGTLDIATDGGVTWNVPADLLLNAGDALELIAPTPADAALADILVTMRGQLRDEMNGPDETTRFLTIVVSAAVLTAALTSFPVFVNLNMMPAAFWEHVNSNGGDIRVTTNSNTQVPVELVSFNKSARSGELHFLAPALSDANDTSFRVWFGNESLVQPAASSAYGRNAVWVDYEGVWHGDTYGDSTGNGHGGVGPGGAGNPTFGIGKVGQALLANGAQRLKTNLYPTATQASLMAWVKLDATSPDQGFGSHEGTTPHRLWLAAHDGKWMWGLGSKGVYGGAATANTWKHLAGRFSGGTSQIFVDGVNTGSTSVTRASGSSPRPIGLVNRYATESGGEVDDWHIAGAIDEIRVGNVAFSAAYIAATHANQKDPTQFLGIAAAPPLKTVNVRDQETVNTVRAELINEIWSGDAYPTAGVDSTTASVGNPLASAPSNLLRIDEVEVDMTDAHTAFISKPLVFYPTSGTSNGKLVVHHHGHGTSREDGDHGALIRALVEDGYTVASILMIGNGSVSTHNGYPAPTASLNYLRYFIEPVIRVINEFEGDFTNTFMTGKSGGGWTVALTAAVDDRIERSVQMAGSLPLYMTDSSRDWEQLLPGLRNMGTVANLDYQDLYVMAADGGRHQLHILNTGDTCCFNSTGYGTGVSFVPDAELIARTLGGSYELFWDAQNSHAISSTARAETLAFFAEP